MAETLMHLISTCSALVQVMILFLLFSPAIFLVSADYFPELCPLKLCYVFPDAFELWFS